MFENPEIAPEGLPTAEDLDWQPLDRRYAARLQVQAILASVTVLIGMVVVGSLPVAASVPLLPIGLGYAVIAGSAIAWPTISVPRMAYAVRERDILHRAGVFRRSVAAIPLNRVQHVETTSTPLDRRFGLANLHLYTAGGSGGDLKIRGMPAAVAERLRIFVLERVGEETGQD